MEYFTLFAWCYTAYRGWVLATWCYGKVRDRSRSFRSIVDDSVVDDECADAVGFHAIHNKAYHNVRPATLCSE